MTPWVMVNGLPGNMARIVAETVVERGLGLVPWSLTGPGMGAGPVEVTSQSVALVEVHRRQQIMQEILREFPGVITVDYTHPSAVNENAKFYVQNALPFVMGTTGGDREALLNLLQEKNFPCVVAPNMAKQIVAFQAMMEFVANQFPGAFSGYNLDIVESHQKTKADTSGTAKAVAMSLHQWGVNMGNPPIRMIRTETDQLEMGVPAHHLAGHAFHTYSLTSSDASVQFQFSHNVCGRKVYAEGTVDAVLFLARRVQQGTASCFSMLDVLRAGEMR